MPGHSGVVAVVHSTKDRTAIWHVDINTVMPMSRLCGAWETDDPKIWRNVLAQRLLLPVDDQMSGPVRKLVSSTAGVFDASATRNAVADVIADLDELHRSTPTAAGNARAPIQWPALPAALDWTNLPNPPVGVVDDEFVARTLTTAVWVGKLAQAWSAVETARTSREHLAGDQPNARPLPVGLAS